MGMGSSIRSPLHTQQGSFCPSLCCQEDAVVLPIATPLSGLFSLGAARIWGPRLGYQALSAIERGLCHVPRAGGCVLGWCPDASPAKLPLNQPTCSLDAPGRRTDPVLTVCLCWLLVVSPGAGAESLGSGDHTEPLHPILVHMGLEFSRVSGSVEPQGASF